MIDDATLAEWEQHAREHQEGAYDPLIDYVSARWLLDAVAEIRRLRECRTSRRGRRKETPMDNLLVSEKRIWFALDQLAVAEAAIGGNPSKRLAIEEAMGYLEAPTPEECHDFYRESNV